MTSGLTRYADISTLVPNIYAGALFTLKQQNALVSTVTVLQDQMGMQPRIASRYGDANPRTFAEGEDIVGTQLSRTSIATLTPAIHKDAFLLTDQRVRTDTQTNIQADASLILGAGFAQYVDEQIADQFASLTGGTVGTAGSPLTWAVIFNGVARLQGLKVPPPYYCALHPYQWVDLVNASLSTGGELRDVSQTRESILNRYFVANIVGGVTFVVTNSINIDGSDDATGAMYSPLALAYDERKAFGIEVERDASRQLFELNASLEFATGVWDASRGIKVITDATAPS